MADTDIGKITRVRLREVWPHEALNLTQWLQQNIDCVADAVGIDLVNPEREQAAGSFSVDILAQDTDGDAVVIENQLEKSDHDHLGKLITYLVAFDAKTAIWIVAEPRTEHVGAIAWLNESHSANFYLLKLEAIKIGNSPPAPLFTLIVGPSDEIKGAGKIKQELAGRSATRHRFWKSFLEKAARKTPLYANARPSDDTWISAGAGKQGMSYQLSIRQHDIGISLYIDRGKDFDDWNRDRLNELLENKNEIDERYRGQLDWNQREGRRSCQVIAKSLS